MSDSHWHDGLTLRRWHLKNFKSVRDTEVELAPLTVVVGANSAGKSTLLQSIRVAAQAANSNSEFFFLNAEQIRLGTFQETRHSGAEPDEPIEIGAQFHLGTSDFYSSPAAYVTAMGSGVARRRPRRDVADNTHLDWSVTLHGTPKAQSASARVVAATATAYVDQEAQATFNARAAKSPSKISSFGHEVQYDGEIFEAEQLVAQIIDANILGGFPRNYLYSEPISSMLFWTWFNYRADEVRATVPSQRGGMGRPRFPDSEGADKEPAATAAADLATLVSEDLLNVYNGIPVEQWKSPNVRRLIHLRLRDYYEERPKRLDNDLQRSQIAEVYERVIGSLAISEKAPDTEQLPELLRDSLAEAREFLATRVQHLGPLRMDPQVVYTSSPSGHPGFIGTKGEYCASVLQNSGKQRVLNSPQIPNGGRPPTLLAAVNAWAVHLGVADAFSTEDVGRLGLQLSVRQPDLNIALDLTSVGTGVSQILPVIVMCLQAPPGSLLLIEQPELHLNPGVQQKLADFLLAVAASGRQLIVETHSEHLVTRLRRRTAEDRSGQTQKRIALVFAERDSGATQYTAVTPEADGSMNNWPARFFDEGAEDSEALLEALLSRIEEPAEANPEL